MQLINAPGDSSMYYYNCNTITITAIITPHCSQYVHTNHTLTMSKHLENIWHTRARDSYEITSLETSEHTIKCDRKKDNEW